MALALLAACTPEVESGVEFGLKASQYTFTRGVSPNSKRLLLLVVDDAPTAEAETLREHIAGELRGFLDRNRDGNGYAAGCFGRDDHAVFFRLQLDVILVPSSAPEAAWHPGNHPELALATDNATSENNASWENSVAEAIRSMQAPSVGPNRILDALHYWDALLTGTSSAPDQTTATFLSSLQQPDSSNPYRYLSPYIFVATSREDESSTTTSDIVWNVRMAGLDVLLRNSAVCADASAQEVAPRLYELSFPKTCDDQLFGPAHACSKYFTPCHPRHPARTPEGQATCRVQVDMNDESPCPEWAGWADPLSATGAREPRTVLVDTSFEEHAPERHRVCEIVQLEGEARISCEQDVACESCTPGFCVRDPFSEEEAPWDYDSRQCAKRGQWGQQQLRVVLGANLPAAARWTVTCDLE